MRKGWVILGSWKRFSERRRELAWGADPQRGAAKLWKRTQLLRGWSSTTQPPRDQPSFHPTDLPPPLGHPQLSAPAFHNSS